MHEIPYLNLRGIHDNIKEELILKVIKECNNA